VLIQANTKDRKTAVTAKMTATSQGAKHNGAPKYDRFSNEAVEAVEAVIEGL
jgi:hypothetical protein